ncbi:MAG: DUF2285 domain-containing protein [Alphaproteobacteria bacterium]|nr:DUF2285 domain-containing protein [Alphaproteobacteria bacterium]MBU2229969.1 DUF2285 domain-containing protein [Alphaproteobacteria bacterium]
MLTVTPDAVAIKPTSIRLGQLDGLDLRRTEDGWHGVWQVDGVAHQFWLQEAAPDAAAIYTVMVPIDAVYDLRSHATRRFLRALHGRRPGPVFRVMPPQLRQFHTLSLRALDARLRGESIRTIAEVLLGFRGSKEDWENDPRRNQARRLAAHGIKMMKGGYRILLQYPVKLDDE